VNSSGLTDYALSEANKTGLDRNRKFKISANSSYTHKRFAAGVNREVIEKGAALLGMDLVQLITDTIMGMRAVAGKLGLEGK
jgi:predicted hydrolase (HD superfamily)